jgi:RNA polymerase sigma-70 factor (ECF subfamily)
MIARSWIQATDRQLVDALLADGDERAFRELYQRYTPRLYRLIINLLDNCEQEAEDVLQETWLRAAAALGTFRWGSSLPTWLSAIALNRAREVRRSRKRWSDGIGAEDAAAPHVSVSERIDLERAVSLLPDGYRSVYELYDVQGYSHEEIARRLGIKPGTSKSQLFHARRSLRGYLEAL